MHRKILLLLAGLIAASSVIGCAPAENEGKGPISEARDQRNEKKNAEMGKKLDDASSTE